MGLGARIASSTGLLGDGVEGDALDLHVLKDAAALQDLEDVPGNRLALAIRVGRQDDLL